ncbi:MAG: DUF1330 domain-containing protein [Pseudomonadota bacterium]
MAKGYLIARITVTDADLYKRYTSANGPIFDRFGARFLVRGGACETLTGPHHERNVVLEFPSFADAKACMASPEYQEIAKFRDAGATVESVVVEGV